mgnify:CR=1 FL=1
MAPINISSGLVHPTPQDLKALLISSDTIIEKWNALTAEARNEFICFVMSSTDDDVRGRRIRKVAKRLLGNKRDPGLFWRGCPHRLNKSAK